MRSLLRRRWPSGMRIVRWWLRAGRLARIADPERVEIECDVLEAVLLQHARQVLSDPPDPRAGAP